MSGTFLCRFSALLLVAFALSGCTSLTDVYPKFAEQSKSIQAVTITSDVLILEDVRGPLPLVDLPRTAAVAAALNQHLKAEFERRGIRVLLVEHAAIGLRHSYASSPPFKIRTAEDGPDKSIAELSTGTSPYFLAAQYTDPARRGYLLNALEDLERQKLTPGMANPISASGRNLGVGDGASHRVLVLVEGVQIPMSKGLLQAVGTGLLTLGTVAVYEMTTVKFRIGLLDASGELIYIGDCTLAGGWTVDDAYLKRQANLFFAQFDGLRKRGSASAASTKQE